ncbi:MAG: hypothetical protein ABXS91_08305 [Sulfurimonas sp.]
MQLSDILEEHSLKNISKKTNISEENIENLLEKRFDKIERVKTMGFLSILEREFNAELATLRSEAQAYYAEHDNLNQSIAISGMLIEEKRGKSKWLIVIVLLLLAYASWYFVTQYDKSHFNPLQPFNEEVEDQSTLLERGSEKEMDIIYTIKQKWNDIVKSDKKEATVTERPLQVEQEEVPEAVVEVIAPIDAEKEKPEETNVARVPEEE